MTEKWHWTPAEAAAAALESGRLSAKLFAHGSLTLRHYAPKGHDPQTPHDQDEVYVVIAGSGRFQVAGDSRPFAAGDLLFVPAGVAHRFLDFSDDFAAWVMFYGPLGGEGG
jgi:mannose-6-phosphate isomerase-like protein (cupin superfamily)